ncbi:unnamed protein product [Meganyctiphanes norvegica]|uniref:Endonuclease/exonuclease/phosphatase domain-containing protein n=1 Tax=Meganyctiphanes norvegica TaxID=48144 RepID=A0AAV2SER7_MEGNR
MAEETNISNIHQMLSAALPFLNCSDAQIQYEFLGEKESFYEKYNCSKFCKDMSEYVNTFTTENYNCNYYDINSFNSTYTSSKNSNLKICHLNIRSLNLHKHELASYLSCLNCKFDIILLTESGHALQASIEETFNDYDFFTNPPSTSKGGAGILVRKNTFKSIEIIDNNRYLNCDCTKCKVESLWINLNSKLNDSLMIGCVYRHPNGNMSHFNSKYSKLLENINSNTTCIIGGDFNIDLLQHEKTQVGEYLNTNLENNFTPCITLPTRITAQSATLIDQLFLRLPKRKLQNKVNSGNLYCSISDHLMNFMLLDLDIKKPKERPYVRLFTEKNIDYFLKNANNNNPLLPPIPEIPQTDLNIHHTFSEFLTNYKRMLEKYFPLVRISRKKFKDKPWITAGIKVSINRRNILFRKFIADRTPTREQAWKSFRNKTTTCIRAAETHYYRKLLTEHNNNCQNLWKIFGKIIKKGKTRPNINKIINGENILTNPNNITEALNNFFTNIGNNLAQSHKNVDQNAFKQYLVNPVRKSFCLCETSQPEVKYLLEKINPKKTPGNDDIPGKFLNISAPIIAEPLSKLFNLSINRGEYPDALKIAKVIPIYKKR